MHESAEWAMVVVRVAVGVLLLAGLGTSFAAGGEALAAAQIGTFFRPRINAEASLLRRSRSILDVYFRFVP